MSTDILVDCSQDDTNYNNKLQAISIYIDCLVFGLCFFVAVIRSLIQYFKQQIIIILQIVQYILRFCCFLLFAIEKKADEEQQRQQNNNNSWLCVSFSFIIVFLTVCQ